MVAQEAVLCSRGQKESIPVRIETIEQTSKKAISDGHRLSQD